MAGIAEQIKALRATLPADVTLVCVSKFHSVEAIREAYEAGERHFGESRVQELQKKVPQLPADIHWHFIGHLQTNKVRDLIKLRPYLIQSVDSDHLLRAINDEAAKQGIIQDVLLEVHTAKEETKTGCDRDFIEGLSREYRENIEGNTSESAFYPNICIRGIMTMATNTDDESEIRRCFMEAHALLHDWPVFSAGMSDDYRIAIDCGANMVRIGSTIFGARQTTPHTLPKAVFFDQDGVLFNSMPYHAKSWEMAMNEHGLPFTAPQAYRNEGRTGAAVIEEAHQLVYGTSASPELIETIYAAKSKHFNRLTGGQLPELIPGIKDVLRYLHEQGVQCWVVTGSGQRSLIDNLTSTFPGIFTGIITAFDVKHGKPNPEPYLKAWERSGFKKEECWVVENAPLGIRAGKAAGLYTIAVNTGPLPDSDLAAEGADRIFPNMAALLQFLRA